MSTYFESSHRVLYNMDILYEIIEYFSPSGLADLTRANGRLYYELPKLEIHTCAQLARVCKSFTQLALDALWSVQHNFDPILLLLPELRAAGHHTPPNVSDVQIRRILSYARRIKFFVYEREKDLGPSHQDLLRLSQVCRGEPLFPSLCSLQLDGVWPVSLLEASLLFSPSIRTILIGHKAPHERFWSKLSYRQQGTLSTHMLMQRCTSLQSLVLRPLFGHTIMGDHTFSLLLEKMDLRTVRIWGGWCIMYNGPREYALLERCRWMQKLSRLSHLHTLTFDATGIPSHQILATKLADFCHLHSIALHGELSTVRAILPFLKSPYLQEVDLHCAVRTLDLHALDDLLGSSIVTLVHTVKHSLTGFDLRLFRAQRSQYENENQFLHDEAPNDRNINYLASVLRSILPLRYLARLCINSDLGPRSMRVSDADIIFIASNLSLLRHLKISVERPLQSPTFHVLKELALRCPRLETHSIPLDVERCSTTKQDLPMVADPYTHQLRYLKCYVGLPRGGGNALDKEKQTSFAKTIHTLFPRFDASAEIMKADKPLTLFSDKWWHGVLEEVATLQSEKML